MLEGILNAYPDLLKKANVEIRVIARADSPVGGKFTLTDCFKKKGMRWATLGDLYLAKVGEKIVNNEWKDW